MNNRTLQRFTSNWVDGDRFWNRDAEIELCIEYLSQGTHLLLVAPRRIGKTSLMREVGRRLQDKFLCLHIDLQKAESPADAVVELSLATQQYAPLWEKVKTIFKNVLDQVESVQVNEVGVTLRGGLTSGDWRAKGDRLLELLAGADKRVVLFLDEVPILVNRLLKGNDYQITPERRQQTDAFLSWLRDNSIRHRDKLVFVVAGSIGLEPVVRQANLSATLNTLTPFDLSPWNRETASGCIRALARGSNLDLQPGSLEAMLERLGVYIPHHVQMFFDYVYRITKLRGISSVSKQLVEEVYQNNMLGTRGHAELSHMEERLKMVLGPDLHPLALDLLTEAAVSGRLTGEAAKELLTRNLGDAPSGGDEALREILSILEHDGYLRQPTTNEYVFVSKLLKDWWKARFGFTFVRVSKGKAR